MKSLVLLLAVSAFGNVRGKTVAVPRLTVMPVTTVAPSLQTLTVTPLAPTLSAPTPSIAPAISAAPAAAAPVAMLEALAVAGPAAPGARENVPRDESARLDALFEGRAARESEDDAVFTSVPGTLPPVLLLKALPQLDKRGFAHPEKLYRKFQRVRKAREVAYWTSALTFAVSGGLALQAVAGYVMPRLLPRPAPDAASAGIDIVPFGASALPVNAPEHVAVREALEELDRRTGRKGGFGLMVARFRVPYLQAFAGLGRDGRPHYLVSADFAHFEGPGGAAAAAAILAHEHAHVYKNDVAHLAGAGALGWKGQRLPALVAATVLAAKAVLLAVPTAHLPYADVATFILLGPSLAWTAGLLALFLASTLAYALLDAAVYRVIEYEADYFAAAHTRPEWMIAALRYLRMVHPKEEGRLFALHPPLRKRIARLQAVFERGAKP